MHPKPASVSQLIGNPTAFGEAQAWARHWADGTPQKPLLVWGPTGTGKTALAHALASEFGWELFEFNASDLRDEENVEKLLANASTSASLFGGIRLILIDDIDSVSPREDRGGAAAMGKMLQSSKQPVVLTATDLYNRKLSSLRTHCLPLQLRKIQQSTIARLLGKINADSQHPLPQDAIGKIAAASQGDVRAALNDLMAGNQNVFRDSQQNIFDAVRTILKTGKYSEAKKATFASEEDHDTLKLWIAQNIPAEYDRPFDIAEAYNSLSRADIFDGRIKLRQYWGFLRYSSDLMSAGVATAKSAPYKKFTQLAFPEYLRQMGATKGSRAMRKSVLRKIALQCHCSLSSAQSYLPHIAGSPGPSAACFGLEEEELEFIASAKAKKPSAKKTK